jgi:hypothetical protein
MKPYYVFKKLPPASTILPPELLQAFTTVSPRRLTTIDVIFAIRAVTA